MTENSLEHLCEFHLQYQKDMTPITSEEPHVGSYLGSGTGGVQGPAVMGKVYWDLFEEQGELVCATNFKGRIEVEGGGEVRFDCLGMFRRPDKAGQVWTMSDCCGPNKNDTCELPTRSVHNGNRCPVCGEAGKPVVTASGTRSASFALLLHKPARQLSTTSRLARN